MKTFLGFLNGFRKLFICLLVLILSTVFVITGHITGSEYTTVLTITVPAYFAGNIGEHTVDVIKDFLKEKLKKIKEK